jgi:alanine dehydrogenase
MMMTAAGTVPPAKVFVMGAGVAGLQAIATAKRLGAVVSATDVRPAAKEQVESLGGTFIAVEDEEFKAAETAGGYAKEMSAAYKKKQQALVEETISKQDIVITTALIPGRPAPVLVTVHPSCTYFLTLSGLAATRLSFFAVSFKIPTFKDTVFFLCVSIFTWVHKECLICERL